MMLANEAVTIQDLTGVLEAEVGKEAGEVAMTEGERLIEQGRIRGQAEGLTEGLARGRASALLALFAARQLPVSEELRQRIESCTDLAQLDRWVARAVTAASAAEALSEA